MATPSISNAETVNHVKAAEKSLGQLRETLEGYIRNQDKTRKKALKMASILKSFAESQGEYLSRVAAT
ncbi:hypothetical protein HK101_011193, partial [Irineochytrium annulatum]